MAKNLLAEKSILAGLKEAKASAKARTIQDGGGLTLICRPDGVGWWRFRYWLHSRENRLSVGVYPAVSLAQARQKRDDAAKLVAAGTDPSKQRKVGKALRERAREAKAMADAGLPGPGNFENVARLWLSTVHESKFSEAHAQRTRTRLENYVFPWLGRRPIAEIEAPDPLTCLRRITARGAIETAHRVKDACPPNPEKPCESIAYEAFSMGSSIAVVTALSCRDRR